MVEKGERKLIEERIKQLGAEIRQAQAELAQIARLQQQATAVVIGNRKAIAELKGLLKESN